MREPGSSALGSWCRTAGLMLAAGMLALAANPATAADPWVFLVHDGKGENLKFFDQMTDIQNFRKGPSGAPEFYEWIAESQRAFDADEVCHGAPLETETMTRAERFFKESFDWYIAEGFGDNEFGRRPAGARVEDRFFGFETIPGQANYLTCSKDGFMRTTNIGANSANRLTVGPAANELNNRIPTFRMSAAHELAHVVQNNTAPYASSSDHGDFGNGSNSGWIVEGTADAVGILYTQEKYGKDYFGPYSDKYTRRFFLSRAYNVPLNLEPGADERMAMLPDWFSEEQKSLLGEIERKTLALLDYQTSGFWYHVIERYLDGEPLQLGKLYRRLKGPQVVRNATSVVDAFLDDIDGRSLDGLEHVYPQFLAEYAAWWDHRFDGHMRQDEWLDLGFDGCHEAKLDAYRRSATVRLPLAQYGGACFKVRVAENALLGDPELEIRLTSDGDVVDEVYLGRASGSGFAKADRNADCYEVVERKLSPLPAPCLLDPRQGRSEGRLQRYFNVPRLRGTGGDIWMTFVAAWVPQDISDVGDAFDQEIVEATVALDYAVLSTGTDTSSGDETPAASDGRTTEARGNTQKAVSEYASKQGRARVSPEGEKAPGEAGPRDLFSGNIDVMPGVPAAMRAQRSTAMEASITVRVESDEAEMSDEVTIVSFQFLEDLRLGEAGPIEVQAMVSRGELTGLQDQRQKSTFTVEDYSDETLQFSGVANVCEGRIVDLAVIGNRDVCRVFKRRSYRVSGAISYPTARNSQARLRNEETEPYLAYRDLRLDTLLGPQNEGGLLQTDAESSGGPAAAGSSGRGGQGLSPSEASCDCSCEAKDSASSSRCKLLCGKEWKLCPSR